MLAAEGLLAAALPIWVSDYLAWWVAGVIVIGGLLAFGWEDVRRLRLRRVWAVSSVAFTEALRRKVLLVTPLAILGILAVCLLQHTIDQQEAIRQTIKYCLFASGMLVTMTAIVLAATNLPREIENRVIYTVVTKPATRLEIVLGKVVGFARVSALIILIMGLFAYLYLEWQDWRFSREIAARLQTEQDPSTRQLLLGYQTAGLLSTKSLDEPLSFQVFEQAPAGGGKQWITGGHGYYFAVPFTLSGQDRVLLEDAVSHLESNDVYVINTTRLDRRTPTKEDLDWIRDGRLPMEAAAQGPGLNEQAKPIPQLSILILDANRHVLVPANRLNGGKPISIQRQNQDGTYTIPMVLPAEAIHDILNVGRFYIEVIPETPSVRYEVSEMPTVLDVIGKTHPPQMIKPAADPSLPNRAATPLFFSKTNRYGMQIVGSPKADGAVAVFQFRNVSVPNKDPVDFRFRAGIERSGSYDVAQAWSLVSLTVVNNAARLQSEPILFHPETNRDSPVAVPAKYLAGGDFDIYIRGLDSGQWIGMTPTSVQFISADHNFAVNLVKSALILWLMSVLVVIIAIFASTFLSWPIAVVLTLVILLGHWSVEQLGESLNPGVGRSVSTDLGFARNPEQDKVVSASVDAMAKLLTNVSKVLPDVSRFPVMDNITRGVNIPAAHIIQSLGVLGCYGLPMLVLGFVILKNKEVAP